MALCWTQMKPRRRALPVLCAVFLAAMSMESKRSRFRAEGIPRREKFERACREVAGAAVSDDELDAMCATYADLLAARIPACPLIPGVLDLLNTRHRFGLCTSAPEDEARGILASRGIDRYFVTIAGYPQSKVSILRRAAASRPVVYFGDGAADAEAAALADVPFVFVGHAVAGEGPRVESFLPTDEILEVISAVAR